MFVMTCLAAHLFHLSIHHADDVMIHQQTAPLAVIINCVPKPKLIFAHGQFISGSKELIAAPKYSTRPQLRSKQFSHG